MQETSFTGASLEKALRDDTLTSSGDVVLVGMVKASEKEGFIGFTPGGCDSWVDIPTGMIENAEKVGQKGCKDHSHPVFRITLKETKNAEGQILLALLGQFASQHSHAPSQPQPWPAMGGPQRGGNGGYGQAPSSGQTAMMSGRLAGGLGGFGGLGGGGLNAWGCWESECCECTRQGRCWPTGDGRYICECAETTCKPCTRCIWPW